MKLPVNFSPADIRTRDLNLLVPAFRSKLEQLLANCQAHGVRMVPFTTRIGPGWEASLYCHSRQWDQVKPIADNMQQGGAPKLAALFKQADCKGDSWKSNALPGCSWHSWGEAVDCYVAGPQGAALWASPSYAIYAEEAKKLGLTAGYYWTVKDSVHVQLRSAGGVQLAWPAIQAHAEATYEL